MAELAEIGTVAEIAASLAPEELSEVVADIAALRSRIIAERRPHSSSAPWPHTRYAMLSGARRASWLILRRLRPRSMPWRYAVRRSSRSIAPPLSKRLRGGAERP